MLGTLTTISQKIAFIEAQFGATRASRDKLNVSVRCPRSECASHGDPHKFKLVIRTTDDLVHCWVCGFKARSLTPLLMRYGTHAALAEYKRQFAHSRPFDVLAQHERPVFRLPDGFRLIAASRDRSAAQAREYLTERGLSEHDMWRYRLGVASDVRWKNRIIVPSFDATGELNFFTGRAFVRGITRYENCDANRNDIIFGEIDVDWSKRIILCEGPFDSFKCGENAVPLLGSTLSEDTMLMDTILRERASIALALDAELALRTQTIGRKLVQYGLDVVIVDLAGRHDPGEMTRAEFHSCLIEARQWSWKDMFNTKLAAATRTVASLKRRNTYC